MSAEARKRVRPQNDERQEEFDAWEESLLLTSADRRVVVGESAVSRAFGAVRPVAPRTAPFVAPCSARAAVPPPPEADIFEVPAVVPLTNFCETCRRYDKDRRLPAGSSAESLRNLKEMQRDCCCGGLVLAEAEARRELEEGEEWRQQRETAELTEAKALLREANAKLEHCARWDAALQQEHNRAVRRGEAEARRVNAAFSAEHPPLEPMTPAAMAQWEEVRRHDAAEEVKAAAERRRERDEEAKVEAERRREREVERSGRTALVRSVRQSPERVGNRRFG